MRCSSSWRARLATADEHRGPTASCRGDNHGVDLPRAVPLTAPCRSPSSLQRTASVPSAGTALNGPHSSRSKVSPPGAAAFLLSCIEEEVVKARSSATLAMLAGIGVGAFAVQAIHAQSKPPLYFVAQIDITNQDGYMNEYAPLIRASIKASGGRLVAAGQPTAVEGEAPKSRVAIGIWDSMEQLQSWRNSTQYKDAQKVGDQYAKFRSYAVEGLTQ